MNETEHHLDPGGRHRCDKGAGTKPRCHLAPGVEEGLLALDSQSDAVDIALVKVSGHCRLENQCAVEPLRRLRHAACGFHDHRFYGRAPEVPGQLQALRLVEGAASGQASSPTTDDSAGWRIGRPHGPGSMQGVRKTSKSRMSATHTPPAEPGSDISASQHST